MNHQQTVILAERLYIVPTGRKGEWQCGDKVEASFSDIISSDKDIGDNFRVIAIVVQLSTNSKTVIPSPCKGISNNHCRLHPQLERTGAVLPYHPFGYNQKGNQEKSYSILLFLGWNTSCLPELESESIF